MFVANEFVYLELHKTACTHIGHWISQFVEGEQIGKHNVLPKELRGRFVLGSIRNPWDWYVSLWGYGCDQRGSVWQQALDGVNIDYYRKQLPREMGRKRIDPVCFARQYFADLRKDAEPWSKAYRDSNDPSCFKAWLRLMFDRAHRLDLREGYGFSPLSRSSGILSYRFFKFFSSLDENLYTDKRLADASKLSEIWDCSKLAGFFVRMEELEEDLIKGLELAGAPLDADQQSLLRSAKANKTNTSSRLPPSYYYDEEAIDMVAKNEKLIIDLFQYQPPN